MFANTTNIRFFFLFIILYLLPIEATFIIGVFIFSYFILIKNYPLKSLLTVLLPIILLLIIGIVFCGDNAVKDIIRDLFNVSKIIVFFCLGVFFSRYLREFDSLYITVKFLAVASAVLHLYVFVINYSSAVSLDQLRALTGRDNIIEAVFLSIYLSRTFSKNFRYQFIYPKRKYYMSFIIVLLSFVLYFSRSMIVTTLMLIAFQVNLINVRDFRSKIKVLTSLMIFLVLALPLLQSVSVSGSEGPFEWLVSKFANIPNEMFWSTNRNYYASLGEINENWRGYEAYQGLMKFNTGSVVNKIFGFGWGSLVDLGLTINLGGQDFEKVPILHNGFVMLLVKSGIIGVILYVLFLLKIGFSQIRTSQDTKKYYYFQMLSAISLVTIFNTFTITGLLNNGDFVSPLLMGAFWGLVISYRTRYQKSIPSIEILGS